MEIKKDFKSVYANYDLVRNKLRPKIVLSKKEEELIMKNHMYFILNTLNLFSSSDIKRIFMLVPKSWIKLTKNELKEIFNFLDNMSNPFDSFYGVFSFLFDIVKLDMYDLFFKEVVFENREINEFIKSKKDILKNYEKRDSIDLKYIEIDNLILLRIKNNLTPLV